MTYSGVDNRACFICGSTDHLILTCNRRVYKEGASHYCFVCGDPYHLAKVCPLRFDLTAVAVVKKSGHLSEIICYKCGQSINLCIVTGVVWFAGLWGHRAEDCSERMCPVCGELGHSSEECPEIFCYKCRQLGHHGRLCYRPVAIYGSSRGGDVVGNPSEDGCSAIHRRSK